MIEASEEKQTYLAQCETVLKEAQAWQPAWLRQYRQEAFAHFQQMDFPTHHDEEWRFTSVAPLLKVPFTALPPEKPVIDLQAVQARTFTQHAEHCLVFVNGRFSPGLSTTGKLPTGAWCGSLAEALKSCPQLVEPHLGRLGGGQESLFAALNAACLVDGAFVYLPKGIRIESPVQLIFVSAPGQQPLVSHCRNLIVAESNSQAQIVESYVGSGPVSYFTNVVSEVMAGENAIVEHYKLQSETLNAFHFATLQIQLRRSSNVTAHSISLGGALTRNDLNVYLDGEGAEATLNGFYFPTGTQHVDNHTRIHHHEPHCTSHELYKGILDQQARGVFNGRIYVKPGAQKTDAKQTNKNLLLSEEALVNTNPQLEIYADDVKCTHGATIGQLEAEALFYLRSRGIGLEEARNLLIYAFASDITGRISIDPLREGLEKLLFKQLAAGK